MREPFDLKQDRDRNRPPGFDKLISDLILAWASFDSGMLFLMCEAFQLPYGNARILLGAMDMKTRIAKVQELAKHSGHEPLKTLMAQWARQYPRAAKPRNVVCHMAFFGTPKGRPKVLLFGPSKPTPDDPENALEGLHIDYFEHSTKWATERSATIVSLLEALEQEPLRILD